MDNMSHGKKGWRHTRGRHLGTRQTPKSGGTAIGRLCMEAWPPATKGSGLAMEIYLLIAYMSRPPHTICYTWGHSSRHRPPYDLKPEPICWPKWYRRAFRMAVLGGLPDPLELDPKNKNRVGPACSAVNNVWFWHALPLEWDPFWG